MDPISIGALIAGIISALGIAILALVKVIKKSSCFYNCCSFQTYEEVKI